MTEQVTVQVFRSDIPENMQERAIEKAMEARDQFTIEKDIATNIKKHFDEEFGGTWHCIVGRNFGASVTFETKYLLFFELGELNILLFKSQE